MLQRFASALFGGDAEELRGSRAEGGRQEQDEDEDWILVECLAEACATQRGHAPSAPATPLREDEDDLVVVPWPSRSPSPLLRFVSSTSLDYTEEEDDEEEEEGGEEEEEGGFLRLDAPPLAESWLVTPPPCFTGGQQAALSCSPLENLLIEHPSMSVYARHDLLREESAPCPKTAASAAAAGKRRGRRRRCRRLAHRSDAATQQRRPALQSAHCAAALSAVKVAQVGQPLSRNALRRLNLLRPLQAGTRNLQQPSQRRLNF